MSDNGCCDPTGPAGGSRPQVEAIVTVDERGQFVLPKDARTRAGLSPGDKLALVSWRDGEEICCFSLIRADRLSGAVQDTLGPLMGVSD
jgi:antitoxin PrlF